MLAWLTLALLDSLEQLPLIRALVRTLLNPVKVPLLVPHDHPVRLARLRRQLVEFFYLPKDRVETDLQRGLLRRGWPAAREGVGYSARVLM